MAYATSPALPPATAPGRPARDRVRTPGKHIVLFLVAAILILTLSTSIIENRPTTAAGLQFKQEGDRYYAPLEPIVVDLATDNTGRDRFVSLRPVIVVRGDAARADLADHQLEARERILFLLRALQPEDFEDDAGMTRVRDELRRRVNLALDGDGAEEVIIDELIIQ